MTLLALKHFWIGVGVLMICGYLIHWGDTHGLNAARVASIQRELDEVNQKVAAYNLKEEQAAVDLEVARSDGYHKALSELATTDRCTVTPSIAAAIGRLQ